MESLHDQSSWSTAVPVQPAAFPLSPFAAEWLDSAQAEIDLSSPLSPLALSASLPSSSSPTAEQVNLRCVDESDAATSPSPPSPAPPQPASPRSPASASHAAFSPSAVDTASSSPSSAQSNAHLKQRRWDAQRRRGEATAMARLEQLSCEHSLDKRKRRKLLVLEASAKRLEQLERLLREAEQANRMSQSQVQALSSELSSVAAREQHSLQWMDASRSLHGAGLLGGRSVTALLDARTGQLLDASSSFFTLTGFTPSGVLQRCMRRVEPAFPTDDASPQPHLEPPLVHANRANTASNMGAGDDGPTQWVYYQPVKQYPSTLELLQELLTGQRDEFRAPFRCRFASQTAHIRAHVASRRTLRLCRC